MADRAVIEVLVREIAGILSKKLAGPDLLSTIDVYCRHFGKGVTNDELGAAVDRWMSTVENPFAPPSVKALRSLLARPVQHVSTGEAFPFIAPGREIIDAHTRARAAIERPRRRAAHTHGPNDEHCVACDGDRVNIGRIVGMLQALPGDPWAGSPRPCKCDGSGWRDTVEAKRILTEWDADTLAVGMRNQGEVYPCESCNPAQWFKFIGVDQ